ncbi:taurine-binding periplasmic protein [Hartmannibacter diazotrophicus]|uniref:Thiamine pyrimidine synthase n=1 Tax=Hartmannibacter diazotrophicus TaxID=1482074 RepID=A0A2C9D0Z1_9HYPH|nr:ABC transporter substrate-binding protein [Hartmannibacter diazotrophicus]SON53920.1 taurine-binding periplasmic protein [Hartmannibacter diazotrophicus]
MMSLFRSWPSTLARCAGIAALGLAAAGPASAADLKPLTVVLPYVPNMESFAGFYAKDKGFFEEAGLDVKLIPGGQGIDQIQMVASGIAQIGMADASSAMAAIDKGAPLMIIAAEYQTSPQAMTCRKDSGITEPSMLKGKKLAIKQNAQVVADFFLAKNNLSRSDMETTAIGTSDIAQIIAGKVDCMFTTFAFNEPYLIEQAGVPVNVMPVGDWGMPSQNDVWVVTKDFLADPENKTLLAAYMTGEMKAWDFYIDNPEKAAEFMVNGGFNDGLNIEQQTYQATHQIAYMTSPLTKEKGLLWIDFDVWKEAVKNAQTAELTSSVLDPSTFLTTEILEMVKPTKH